MKDGSRWMEFILHQPRRWEDENSSRRLGLDSLLDNRYLGLATFLRLACDLLVLTWNLTQETFELNCNLTLGDLHKCSLHSQFYGMHASFTAHHALCEIVPSLSVTNQNRARRLQSWPHRAWMADKHWEIWYSNNVTQTFSQIFVSSLSLIWRFFAHFVFHWQLYVLQTLCPCGFNWELYFDKHFCIWAAVSKLLQ